jgi:phage internal scaffolding protein
MKIRKPYTQGTRVQSINELPSRTKQSDTEDCEINNIMAKYMRTGAIDHFTNHEAKYSDTTGADFETAMNIVANAQNMFADLPSKLRAKFKNDPRQFLDFVQNEENAQEMTELGLTNSSPETPDLQSEVQGETDAEASEPVEST